MFLRQVSKLVLVCIVVLLPVLAKAQVGCPNVNAGPDVTVGCSNPCTNLTATWFDSGQTNNYLAIPISYTPNPYNVGTPILVNIDDTWSPVINLPFNFCFFGSNYNQVVIGSNGIISFNTTYASNGCPWNLQGYPLGIPNATLPTASIMGIFQDIDPTNQGTIYYQLTGAAPCRKLIVSFFQIPYYGDPNSVSAFSCPTPLFATTQIVLYETTNAIDIFTQNKPVCSGWNGGLAIQGIQNMAGTQAVVIPGRNNTVFTATNDAWRFLPFGASISSFAWLQGASVISTNPIVNVCPTTTTTYTARVTYTTCTGNSVVVTDNVTVTPNSTVQASISVLQNISCNNGNNGSVGANLVAGQAPVTYQWSPNAGSSNSQTVNGLFPGTYTVTVTDASGCSSVSSISLVNPPPISTATNITNVSCNGGSNGSITAIPANGTAPYSFNWSPVAGSNATLGSLTAGNYNCIITDVNGCTSSATGLVTQPNVISATVSSTNLSCNGGSNGTASVNSQAGGTAPFSYSWNTNPIQSTATATNLVAGTYAVTITDANGCTFTSNSTNIVQPTSTVLSATPTATICGQSNGTITVVASGGTAPYNFNLNGGTNQGSTFFNNLAAGNYTITATDANGCTSTFNTTVAVLPTINIQSSNSTAVSCFGGNNGTISIVATGGVAPLQYNLSGNPQQPTPSWSNLTSGNYTVIVTDANNCASTVTVTVAQPTLLTASANNGGTTCSNSNGSLNAIASGGTSPYSYSINGGSAQSGAVFNNLMAGLYNLLVTDANGCTANASTTIIDQPGPVITSSPTTNASCFGGSDGTLTINTTLGAAPLTYSVNGGPSQGISSFTGLSQGNYSILITDANGCTVSSTGLIVGQPLELAFTTTETPTFCGLANGTISILTTGGTSPFNYSINGGAVQSSNFFNNLAPGNYNLLVTDANGCTNLNNETVGALPIIDIPAQSTTPVSCYGGNNGSISISASGGTPPLQFNLAGSPQQPSPSWNNLTAGNYTVIVTDANNCASTVTVTVAQPTLLTASATNNGTTCSNPNGSLSAIAGGGTAPYFYSVNGGAAQSGAVFNNLVAGPYNLIVTDANGCTANSSTTIIDQPGPVITSSPTTNVSCFGGSNGTVTVNTNLGTAPLSFSVNGGANQAINSFNGLSQGNYSILVTDANGCTTSAPVNITEPTLLSTTSNLMQHSCNPIPNGSAQVTAQGGTAPYVYAWSPAGGTNSIASGLAGGTYTILVTDGNGCTSTSNVVVLQSNLNIVLTPDSVTCFGGNDGGITAVVTGNTGSVSYSWNPTSQNTPNINSLAQGSYTLTVVDSINCTTTATASVGQPLPPPVQLSASPTGICYGKSTLITAGGGVSYQWSNGASTNQLTVNPTMGTTYTVTITNASGCTNSSDITIPVFPLPVVGFVSDTVCAGQSTSFTNNSNVSAGIIASYQWNFSNGSSSSSMNPAATFGAGVSSAQLVATTDQGCVDSISAPVRVWNLPVADFVADTTAGCPPVNVNFTDLSTSLDGPITSWLWSSGNGNTSAVNNLASFYPNTGFYDVGLQVTTSFGCVSDTLFASYIQVYDQPVANFSTMPLQPSVYVPNVEFGDESVSAATWYWDFGDASLSNLQNPFHTYVFPGTYQVTLAVESQFGCTDTMVKEVVVLDEVSVWMPSSFSPNGDGVNDVFSAIGYNISNFNMQVFNRLGQIIFTSTDSNMGWDGKFDGRDVSQDIYVYRVDYKTITNEMKTIKGHLTLIR